MASPERRGSSSAGQVAAQWPLRVASASAASRTGAEQRLVFSEHDAVEGDEHDRRRQRGPRQEGRDLGERDATRARDRKAVHAARDRREREARKPARRVSST